MSASVTTTVTWYVARNHYGQFSYGENWVDDISRARFYSSIAPAKCLVTRCAKDHPDWPIPEILEWKLDIATATVIDQTERTKSAIFRQKQEEVKSAMREMKEMGQRLAAEIARKQGELERISR